MSNSTFQRGAGSFTCEACGRKTRHTGVQDADSRLCPEDYELAGLYNTMQDEGAEGLAPYASEITHLCKTITDKGGELDGDARELLAAITNEETTVIDIESATTAELVAFYNKRTGSSIKKFQDRATAEKRVRALMDAAEPKRSQAIAESWRDPAVAEKRKQRSGVLVDGVEYNSVRAAHVALDLPLKDHIRLRMLLKEANGPLEVDGREWVVVPKNY